MADSRFEICDEELDNITGGKITFTWSDSKQTGTLGMNGKNTYLLLDKTAFLNYYNSVFGTISDADIIRNLRNMGIIKKP